jgi:glycosyltransferase involved in cell wall biosynthesis
VGRLLERKGYNELIHAFHRFHQQYPTATLSIAGDGPYGAYMSTLIARYELKDAVYMLGGVNNVPELMATHDCLVFPSHYEGFSGTLIEAMLAGLPIIASDIEMNKEAVVHNDTARLFRVTDSDDLLENMIWVHEHQREALDLATRARKVAERRFDIEEIARQHESYYDRLISAVN